MSRTIFNTVLLTTLAALPLAACMTDDDGDIDSAEQEGKTHVKGGKDAKPAFEDAGLSLIGSGDLAGLGNADVLIKLVAVAQPISTCTNPAGATQPPGQNPALVDISGSVAIPAAEIKNGTLHFVVETQAPSPTVAGAPDCPNATWTQAVEDMAFLRGTVIVEQPAGTPKLTLRCSFTPMTEDGLVPTANVYCN
jgi:hypothetical protein